TNCNVKGCDQLQSGCGMERRRATGDRGGAAEPASIDGDPNQSRLHFSLPQRPNRLALSGLVASPSPMTYPISPPIFHLSKTYSTAPPQLFPRIFGHEASG
ncbi:hypothetical protein RD792_004765, partial [Penstemon davidsonii]